MESVSELFNFEFAVSKNFDCFAISVTNINSRIRLRISIFLKIGHFEVISGKKNPKISGQVYQTYSFKTFVKMSFFRWCNMLQRVVK